jgi:hypothetical protein
MNTTAPNLRLPPRRQWGGPTPPPGDGPTRVEAGTVTEYTPDEDEFIVAVARFRDLNHVASPTLCELLWIVRQLGYRKLSATPAAPIQEGDRPRTPRRTFHRQPTTGSKP